MGSVSLLEVAAVVRVFGVLGVVGLVGVISVLYLGEVAIDSAGLYRSGNGACGMLR